MALYKRIPTQLVVAAFAKEETANACLKAMGQSMADGDFVLTNLAICVKTKKGKIRVKELGKPGPIKGTAVGTTLGTAVGAAVGGAALMFLGPIGIGAGALAGGVTGGALGALDGAAVGTAAALTTKSMDKSKLKELGSALEPESCAIVAVLDEVIIKKSDYKDELKIAGDGVDLLVDAMKDSISTNIKAGNDIAYLLAVDEEGIVASKMVVGDGAIDVKALVMTTDEAKVGEITATEEGVAVQAAAVTAESEAGVRALATEEGVAYEVAAVADEEGVYAVGAVAAEDEEA